MTATKLGSYGQQEKLTPVEQMAFEMSEYACMHMTMAEVMPTLIGLYTQAMLEQNTEEHIIERYNQLIGKSNKEVH